MFSKHLRALFLSLCVTACARPDVDVPRDPGERGEFCVTADDCGGGLGCLERRCCAGTACATTCDRALANGTELGAAVARHSASDRQHVRGGCLTLCCAGRSPADLTAELERLVSSPGYH